MELAEFERVYDSFCAFHAEFAPDFGRKQWRENSDDYLQGLLVQTEERRNAENMAEAVPLSARALQRFLTDARWDDAAVAAHLQAYLAPKLTHPRAVGAVDSSGIPKEQQVYHSEAQLALAMLLQAQARGHLGAEWVTGDDTFGKSPEFRDGVAATGLDYVLEIPPETPVWPLAPS